MLLDIILVIQIIISICLYKLPDPNTKYILRISSIIISGFLLLWLLILSYVVYVTSSFYMFTKIFTGMWLVEGLLTFIMLIFAFLYNNKKIIRK